MTVFRTAGEDDDALDRIAKELRTANTLKVIEEARKLADVDYDDMLDKTLASLFTEYLK